jgi:hypothetical protein
VRVPTQTGTTPLGISFRDLIRGEEVELDVALQPRGQGSIRETRKRSLGGYCPLQIEFVLPPVPYAAKSSGCSEISGTAQFADHHTLGD